MHDIAERLLDHAHPGLGEGKRALLGKLMQTHISKRLAVKETSVCYVRRLRSGMVVARKLITQNDL
jgi:hypothetical protein